MKKNKKRLDRFNDYKKDPLLKINKDIENYQDAKKLPWVLEQEELNQIDIDEQKRIGGIKPMDEQFPGYTDGYDPRDSFESDNIRKEIMRMK